MKTKIFILLLSAAFVLISCNNYQSGDDSPVIATVQSTSLTLQEALKNIPEPVLAHDTTAALLSYREQWIDEQIMIHEAERIGLSNSPEIRSKLIRLRGQILQESLREFVLNEHKNELEVTREEAQNYYQEHKEQFTLDERYVRFRHLTTRTRTEADNAKRDLMRGISWNEVAEKYSVNSEVQIQKSSQFWPVSMSVGDNTLLKQYLNVIGITEISPIQHFRGQYHFVQLMEERPAGSHPDLEWLIPQITEWLKLEKARRISEGYVRNLYLESEANNEIGKPSVTEIESFISNNLSN